MDVKAFRKALGAFPTGVTIVTTRGADGHPVGVTASSFNSVSLDPPLVLWSLAKTSKSHDDFAASSHFAVHVLAADQDELSNRFARSGEDKFAGLDIEEGEGGCPLLPDYGALFQCQTMHKYAGGDHVILVGEVVKFEQSDRAPLVFHGGRYAEARERTAGLDPHEATVNLASASFTDSFLLYLLSRAHYQTTAPIRDLSKSVGLDEATYAVLCRLSMASDIGPDDVVEQMAHTGLGIDRDIIMTMLDAGLIEYTPAAAIKSLRMSHKGEGRFLEVLSAAKAHEEAVLKDFSPGEIFDFKSLLRKLIGASGERVSIPWRD